MRIGVHCSVRNGFAAALRETAALGCNTLQIFTKSPRDWRTRVYEDWEFAEFRREREKLGVHPVVVHTPYLPNLCTSVPTLFDRSVRALREDLARCEQLAADYLVIHPGAFSPEADYKTGLRNIVRALTDTFAAVKGRTRVLIENMAGGGRRIGGPFREVADILNGVPHRGRLGVCFDTCHATGAGYDLSRPGGVEAALREFDREIGLKEIPVFHVNDSKAPPGSHRDLHQHIGKGHVGLEAFRRLFAEPAFRDCALILETPKEGPSSDPGNIKALRACLPAG
jgi:deoxyribonuclease IV